MSDVSAVPGQKVPAEAVADPAALLNGSLQSLGLRLASGAQVTDEGVQGDFEGTLFGLLPCRGRILGGAPGGAEGLRAEVHLTGGTADLERDAGNLLRAAAQRASSEVAALEQQAEAAKAALKERVQQEAARLHAEGERMRRELDAKRRTAGEQVADARGKLAQAEKELGKARQEVERRREAAEKDLRELQQELDKHTEHRKALEREIKGVKQPKGVNAIHVVARIPQLQAQLAAATAAVQKTEERLKRARERPGEPLDDTNPKVAPVLERFEAARAALQAAEQAEAAAGNGNLPEWAAKPEKVQAEAERTVSGAEVEELRGRAAALRRERGRLVGLAERLAAAADAKPLEIRDITFETRLGSGMSPRVPARVRAAVLQADGQRAEQDVEVELNLAYLPEAAQALAQKLAA